MTPPFFDRARIGHNKGPALEGPSLLLTHAWKRAAAERRKPSGLVLRMQVARAREMGLAPADYFSIRAFCGRDPEAFAFTPEGLQLTLARRLAMPERVRDRLGRMRHVRLLCFAPPGEPPEPFCEELSEVAGVAFAASAPMPETVLPWSEARAAVRRLLDPGKLTGSAVLLVGRGALAEQMCAAANLATLLPPERLWGT